MQRIKHRQIKAGIHAYGRDTLRQRDTLSIPYHDSNKRHLFKEDKGVKQEGRSRAR